MYDVIKDNADLLIRVIQRYGAANQMLKATEEVNELATAYMKAAQRLPHNVEEEMADVYIMLAQMRLLFDHPSIDGFIEAKLERLKREINKNDL